MNVTRVYAGVLSVCLCAVAAPASAQQMPWTEKGFATINFGGQFGSHDLSGSQTVTIYDEDSTITSQQKIKSAGFFDLGGGYKVKGNIAVGLSYTRASSKSDATVSGSIPDPLYFDRGRLFSASLQGAKHTENVVNLSAIWMDPITDKIRVSAAFGPSIFSVKQGLISSTPIVTEDPFTVQTPAVSVSKTTVGINLGVDVTYLVGPKWGVGGLARYTWGSVDLPGTAKKLTVGGFQLGGGARLLF